jgi:hypothetical protein
MNVTARSRRTGTGYAMWITGSGLLLILVFLGISWMQPLTYSDAELRQEAHRRYGSQLREYEQSVRARRTSSPLRLPLNRLVDLEVVLVKMVPVQQGTGDAAPPGENFVMRAKLRLEIVVTVLMMIAFLVVLFLNLLDWMRRTAPRQSLPATRETIPETATPHPAPADAGTPASDGFPPVTSGAPPAIDGTLPPRPAGAATGTVQGAEQVFIDDVALLKTRAEEFIVWAGLYLLGGLMTSAVGIAAFFLFTPRLPSQAGTTAVLLAALRPTATLLFFEGVAFFLLRQHKALLREHGRLLALTLKRNNWVAACRLLAAGALANPASASLIAALAGEAIGNTADDGDSAADSAAHNSPVLAGLMSNLAKDAGGPK